MHLNSVDDVYNSQTDAPIYQALNCTSNAEKMMCFLLNERTRELCGEQWRWYDLKRTGYLNADYLVDKHKNPYISFEKKNLVRPIPQEFLDQIANADEFGTNGY